jgi:hypothetical protein
VRIDNTSDTGELREAPDKISTARGKPPVMPKRLSAQYAMQGVTMVKIAACLIVLAWLAGCAPSTTISSPPDDLQHPKPGPAGAY